MERLGEMLVQGGLVTDAGIAAARADAAQTKKRLPETVIDLGLVNERRFATWMAQISGSPLVDPIPEDAATAVQQRVTSGVARELQVVPLRYMDEGLEVVMVNPLDRGATDVLQAVTGLHIRPMTGVRSEIERLVNRLYPQEIEAPDVTILPPSGQFALVTDGEAPLEGEAPPAEEAAPFDFSNETLLRRPPGLDLIQDWSVPDADGEFGTIVAGRMRGTVPETAEPAPPPPVPPPPSEHVSKNAGDDSTLPTNPVAGLERRLDQVVRVMTNIEKRIDDLKVALANLANR